MIKSVYKKSIVIVLVFASIILTSNHASSSDSKKWDGCAPIHELASDLFIDDSYEDSIYQFKLFLKCLDDYFLNYDYSVWNDENIRKNFKKYNSIFHKYNARAAKIYIIESLKQTEQYDEAYTMTMDVIAMGYVGHAEKYGSTGEYSQLNEELEEKHTQFDMYSTLGEIEYIKGNYEKSQKAYQESNNYFFEGMAYRGINNPRWLFVLEDISRTYLSLKNYDEGEDFFNDVKKRLTSTYDYQQNIETKKQLTEWIEEFHSLTGIEAQNIILEKNTLAEFYIIFSNFFRSSQQITKSIEILKAIPELNRKNDVDEQIMMQYHTSNALNYFFIGEMDKALEHGLKTKELELKAKDYSKVISTNTILGGIYTTLAMHYMSERLTKESCDIAVKHFGKKSSEYADCLIQLADKSIKELNITDAQEKLNQAINILKISEVSFIDLSNVLERYATVSYMSGNIEETIEILNDIVQQYQYWLIQMPQTEFLIAPSLANIKFKLAWIYYDMNKIDEAINFFKEGTKLLEKNPTMYFLAEINYANFLFNLNMYDEVSEIYEELRSLDIQISDSNMFEYLLIGLKSKLSYFEVTKLISEQSLSPSRGLPANVKAKWIKTENDIKKTIDLSYYYNDITIDTLSFKSSLAILKIWRYDLEGLDLLSQSFDEVNNFLIKDYHNLSSGSVFLDATEKNKLGLYLNIASWIYPILTDFKEELSDREIVKYMDDISNKSFTMLQILTETSVNNVLKQASMRYSIANKNLSNLIKEKNDLVLSKNKLLEDIPKIIGEDFDNEKLLSNQTKAIVIQSEIDKINENINIKFPDFNSVKNVNPLSIEEIQNVLNDNEAILYYSFPESKTMTPSVVVIRKDAYLNIPLTSPFSDERYESEPEWLKAPMEAIPKLIKNIRYPINETINQKTTLMPFSLENSFALYLHLIEPLESSLSDIDNLIIVKNKYLQGLPFSLLVSEVPIHYENEYQDYKNAEWLINDYSISTVPSISSVKYLRTLQTSSSIRTAELSFVGFGNPILGKGASSIRNPFRGNLANVEEIKKMRSLPETEKELYEIASILNSSENNIYVDQRANETMIKSLDLRDKDIIVFATHALVSHSMKGLNEPALVLTPPDKASLEDDGLLTASEILQLNLNAELVILSACNTAASKETDGMGLSGLAKSFIYAGTKTLLVSNWDVDSKTASFLTTKTIKYFVDNPEEGKANALRKAMIELIASKNKYYSHPFYWAPFMIVGEGN